MIEYKFAAAEYVENDKFAAVLLEFMAFISRDGHLTDRMKAEAVKHYGNKLMEDYRDSGGRDW